jgi:Tfp pilus assembly protein PilF
MASQLRKLAIVWAVAGAFSLPMAAQIPSMGNLGGGIPGRRGRYTISGSVRDSEGSQPIEFAAVRLLSVINGASDITTTGSNGNFTFDDVPSGTYRIVVDEKGYQRLQQEITVRGGPFIGLQLTLKPNRPPLSEKVGDGLTVSARQLMIPRRAREAMTRGSMLANDKADYQGSLAEFERAVREYPGYYEAYLQMGLAYLKLGDEPNAEQMLQKSVEISERKFIDALTTLATLYANQKRFADAEPLARDAIGLDANSWDGQVDLARALYGLDRVADAEAVALQAERIRPDDGPVHLLLANIHLKMQNFPALITDLDTYLKLVPEGPLADQARRMRAQIVEHMSRTEPGEP